mgnify:CR=1 FL=1
MNREGILYDAPYYSVLDLTLSLVREKPAIKRIKTIELASEILFPIIYDEGLKTNLIS